ncbi:ATP-binding protein [Conexibacter woesei]|nr:LuxR family transcriptional regulator [Conexibacter woesei]
MRRGRRPLLERDGELQAIRAALRGARAGAGRTLVVEGPAGIGKTVLLQAAATSAARTGTTVLWARGSELERRFPFGVVRELLEPPLRDPAMRAAVLTGAAGLCAPLFERGDPADLPAARPAVADTGLLHGLYWLVCALADRAPLVLVVDDAQWADARSQDLLAFLAPRVGELPVALVAATRPPVAEGDVDVAVALGGAAERIAPQPLSTAAVRRLLAEELGEPEPAFVAACLAATGGSPFYVRELIGALATGGTAPLGAQAAQAAELGPETIARAILPRIARVSPDAVAVARALAILGDGAELSRVAALAGLDEAAATAAAAALCRAGVLAPERRPRFEHPIVRSAIASGLTAVERAQAHRRAARLLAAAGAPSTRVAAHLLETDAVGEPWARDALLDAARRARDEGAIAVALQCLRRALAEPPDEHRHALLLQLGEVAFQAGERDALDHLETAWRDAAGPRQRARAARALAVPLVGAGRIDEALERLRQAVVPLAGDDPLAIELTAHRSSLALLAPMELTARVMAEVEAHEPPAARTGAECMLLGNLAYWGAMRGAPAESCMALAERSLAGGVLLDEEGPASLTLHYAVLVLISADAFAAADDHLAAALRRARATGSVLGFALCSLMRSLSAYRRGALADAEVEARHTVDTVRLHGWEDGLPGAVGFLVDALVDRGRLDEAVAVLEDAGLGRPLPEGLLYHPVLVARARLAIACGDRAAGLEDLRELGRRDERDGARATIGTPTWRGYAAPVLAALGEREEALRLAEEELALARRWGAPRGLGFALRARGAVADPATAVDWHARAVETLEGTPARLELARSLTDLGTALRRARRPRDAREPLRRAADLATRCDASLLAERAVHELGATGARRRSRTLLTGVEALTPSERRIAAMAAGGMTNREIAEALFLTRKTIEMHLGGAYRKLGISSREELPSVLEM